MHMLKPRFKNAYCVCCWKLLPTLMCLSVYIIFEDVVVSKEVRFRIFEKWLNFIVDRWVMKPWALNKTYTIHVRLALFNCQSMHSLAYCDLKTSSMNITEQLRKKSTHSFPVLVLNCLKENNCRDNDSDAI